MTRFVARFVLILGVSFLAACGGGSGGGDGGDGNVQQAPSFLCPGITGMEAIAWDLYNGVVRTDPVLPPAPPAGPGYQHPEFLFLSFFYPAGYSEFTTNLGIHELGVNIVRDDNQVVWRHYDKNVPGVVSAAAIRDGETQQVLDHLGQGGAQIQTVCNREDSRTDSVNGVVVSVANTMFRVGNHTAMVFITTTFIGSTGSTSSRRKVYLAPTAEFNDRVLDTFLAIDWQMTFGTDSGLRDTDQDGWRDAADIEPLNPNEPTPGGLPGSPFNIGG